MMSARSVPRCPSARLTPPEYSIEYGEVSGSSIVMFTPGTVAACVGRPSPPRASCHANTCVTACSVVVRDDVGVESVTVALIGAPV